MRSMDEQLALVRSRAAGLRRKRGDRRRFAAASAVCLLLIAVLGILMPEVSGKLALPEEAVFGSLVLASPAIGYIVIGILAFALGVLITLFSCCRRETGGDTEEDDS